MYRKITAILIIFLCALTSTFASDYIPYEKVEDERVKAFIEEYTEQTPLDEFVSLMAFVDGIYFEYDEEDNYYSVIIQYSDGNLCQIDFLYMQINMYYVDIQQIPSEMKSRALEVMNDCQARDYQYALGAIILDGNTMGARYIILEDGISDFGEWLFWHFYIFESYSRNLVDEIMIRLGLRETFFW